MAWRGPHLSGFASCWLYGCWRCFSDCLAAKDSCFFLHIFSRGLVYTLFGASFRLKVRGVWGRVGDASGALSFNAVRRSSVYHWKPGRTAHPMDKLIALCVCGGVRAYYGTNCGDAVMTERSIRTFVCLHGRRRLRGWDCSLFCWSLQFFVMLCLSRNALAWLFLVLYGSSLCSLAAFSE